MNKLYFLIVLFTFCSNCLCQSVTTRKADPTKVKFVTSDIPNFWSAFDSCKLYPQNSVAIFNKLYFVRGSVGLATFKDCSIKSTENIVKAIDKYRGYYESVRQNTLQIEVLKPQMRKALIRFKKLYPAAMFPDVYFLIGDLNSGGKSEKTGLLIGAEVNCADSNSNFTNIYPPFVKVLKLLTLKNIPQMVIHELVHYQQSYADSSANLLGYAIKEGSAEFITELVEGKVSNQRVLNYGEQHQQKLWDEFKKDMHSFDINNWFYNSGTDDIPGDLGYYIGYKITQAYYLNSKDKKKAINEILNTKDFDLFLKNSKYEDGFISIK